MLALEFGMSEAKMQNSIARPSGKVGDFLPSFSAP